MIWQFSAELTIGQTLEEENVARCEIETLPFILLSFLSLLGYLCYAAQSSSSASRRSAKAKQVQRLLCRALRILGVVV